MELFELFGAELAGDDLNFMPAKDRFNLIDSTANEDDLNLQLYELISDKTVLSKDPNDDFFSTFDSVEKFLLSDPIDLRFKTDIEPDLNQ